MYLYWFSYYQSNFTHIWIKKNTKYFYIQMEVSFPVGTLGAFVLFSSNMAKAKNNFVTIPLELLQNWFMDLVRKLAPFYT